MNRRERAAKDYFESKSELWRCDSPGEASSTKHHNKLWCDYLLFNEDDIKGKEVLNIGAEYPQDEIKFAHLASRWTTIDFSEVIVKNQKAICGEADFVVMDAREMTFPENSFDTVLILSTLDHIPGHRNRLKVLDGIHRVLKPGGILAISVPYGRRKDNPWYGYEHTFSEAELIRMVKRYFEIVVIAKHAVRLGIRGINA